MYPIFVIFIALTSSSIASEVAGWEYSSHAGESRGNAFLAAQPQVSTAVLRQSLWAKLGARAKPFRRLLEIENELHASYAALPKNEYGNIDRAVVRYAARRYFVHYYGWHVKGLESTFDTNSSSSSSSVQFDRAPSYVLGVFEEYTGKRGFSVRDLAIFLATIEDLVSTDMMSDVMDAYRLHGLPTEGKLSADAAHDVLTTYMSSYIAGVNISNIDLKEFREQNMEETYPGWSETVMWVSDVRRALEFTNRDRANPFVKSGLNLATVEQIVTAIGRQYGSFQDLECRSLKSALLSREYRSTGRVLLSDFYQQGQAVDWQFTESVRYLRDLGALDESHPDRPSVLLPNYLNGPSNCLISTSFYTLCCMDECNGLFHHLENLLAAPLAEASHVLEVVSRLPSDTVHAPRNLSVDLQRRLHDIANHHEGRVPLHGRLFSQWMHYAYPRECPFPHVSGTTSPMTQEEWVKVHGAENIMASETEKHAYVKSRATDDVPDAVPHLLWHNTEELVAPHVHRHRRNVVERYVKLPWLLSLGKVLLFVAPLSLAAQLLRDAVGRMQNSRKGGAATPSGARDYFV